jgi:periodic tryptophan protein 1
MVLSRDLDLGKIFTVQFGPDPEVSMRVAVAGSMGSIKVWDLSTSSVARKAFGVRGRSKETVEEGNVVGISEDKEEESDGDEDQGEGWEEMDDE